MPNVELGKYESRAHTNYYRKCFRDLCKLYKITYQDAHCPTSILLDHLAQLQTAVHFYRKASGKTINPDTEDKIRAMMGQAARTIAQIDKRTDDKTTKKAEPGANALAAAAKKYGGRPANATDSPQ